MLTEIAILEILYRNRNFFVNFDRNQDFRNIDPKSIFVSKMLTEIEIFKILNRIRIFFLKMLTEIEIFAIMNRYRKFF